MLFTRSSFRDLGVRRWQILPEVTMGMSMEKARSRYNRLDPNYVTPEEAAIWLTVVTKQVDRERVRERERERERK